jgi:hypothetical protein
LTNTFVIPKNNLDWLERRVATLNKKASKLGVPEINLDVLGSSKPVERTTSFGAPFFIPTILVELTGEIPRVSGWRLIARLNRTPAGNVINSIPGAPATPNRAKTFYGCEHCGYKRNRKDVFVLENGGEHKIVGRTCLSDFFGGANPDTLINYAKQIDLFLRDVNRAANDDPIVTKSRDAYPLNMVLTYTAGEIAAFGWIPSTKARIGIGNATRYWVGEYLEESIRAEDRYNQMVRAAKEKGYDLYGTCAKMEIDAAIDWAINLAGDNDYEWSIRSIARTGFSTWRQLGFACSILPAYRNFVNRQKKPVTQKPSTYVGKVGEKVTLNGKVVFIQDYDTAFGYRTLVKIVTTDDQMVNWWASEPSYQNGNAATIERGDEIRLSAKIKNHDEYKGTKQTTVNYGKIWIR